MIKPWIFEFMQVPDMDPAVRSPATVSAVFDEGFRTWLQLERLGFEGIFFSEHHFGLSYSPSPNLLLASIARHTTRLRLGTMGMVAPFYEPWRIVEELIMLDHLTNGRLEIGMAAGVPQELVRIGLSGDEARERFNEILEILDAALLNPVINHKGKHWQFENLTLMPNAFVQPSPPKWTTVVSPASARKSAQRQSKICSGFESVGRFNEIFDAYRDEAARLGVSAGPDQLGIRRHVSVSRNSAEARVEAESAKAATMKVIAADPRAASRESALLDAPKAGSGFSLHADEFIAGSPDEVAEQIVDQCRRCGAGHFLAMLGRSLADRRDENIILFGEEVIPRLRRANIG
ncbi:LLM class flavin-dependent oxidoreductase [Bradyrhizobium stylosanthis]|uniref:Alkanesulfonate monooxygenase SsuD/methylene tetrahydromethanopterin reductase-like flavin-dependent oxidoreductase (Luciferase family) n=1 Tax=Bradyrhizobium stylosanthis TaxID=1803665 RepID=A0A560DZ74_9BRAD|nr:LLM class flavin-dependent oxidoreductase [Bradyrhizobium stylosanthis]TWB02415.1 alkanesulfonate monooxygenase SsuD/methylene tetrahydromethanopterin reductase-like flavin-dependent oxidoreductase (luciferase family) [Bradyrhizobium stylosanthis]